MSTLKVFANEDAAEKWFAEYDPESVAYEYELAQRSGPSTEGLAIAGAVLYGRATSRHAFRLNPNFNSLSVRPLTFTLGPSRPIQTKSPANRPGSIANYLAVMQIYTLRLASHENTI